MVKVVVFYCKSKGLLDSGNYYFCSIYKNNNKIYRLNVIISKICFI